MCIKGVRSPGAGSDGQVVSCGMGSGIVQGQFALLTSHGALSLASLDQADLVSRD